jgi:hypothetical protein
MINLEFRNPVTRATFRSIRDNQRGIPRYLALLVAMLLLACQLGGPSPQSYSCGTVSSSAHCYAKGTIGDHLTGFRSTFTVVGRILPGDGFITNEFWLINYEGVNGWIEIGYQSKTNEPTQYFWAELDPDTAYFTKYYIDPIPQEEIDTRVVFDIHQTGEDTFDISIDGSKTHFSKTVHINLWDRADGGYVNLGQELAGSKNAEASFAMFVDNQVYDNRFRRRFATDNDKPRIDPVGKPPYGGWLQTPTSKADNRGGVFSTYCCAP